VRVGFYLTQGDKSEIYYRLAKIMMRSVRKAMPGVEMVQFTDMSSEAIDGADDVSRHPSSPLPLARSNHYASVEGEWLFIDTDVVVQADVRDVFDNTFDIAIADRNWYPSARVSKSFEGTMKYNVGVVFSRQPAFWKDVHTLVATGGLYNDPWFGDQKAVSDIIATGKYRVEALPGMLYNYPPSGADDPALGAKIVHCKGNRKEWMLRESA
jgi:hypothetical protein